MRLFITRSPGADGETARLQDQQSAHTRFSLRNLTPRDVCDGAFCGYRLAEDLTPGLTAAGVTSTVSQGRPVFAGLFQELRGGLSGAAGGGAVVAVPVYVCGPTAMTTSVLKAAIPKVPSAVSPP